MSESLKAVPPVGVILLSICEMLELLASWKPSSLSTKPAMMLWSWFSIGYVWIIMIKN